MLLEDMKFIKNFKKITEDAWLKGWHERNGGNITYRLTEDEVAGIKDFINEENTIHVKKEAFGIAPKDMIKLAEELGDIDEIELVGVVSNICVISNVCTFQAQYPNAQITVDSNLCASFDESLHEKVLDVMEGLQVQVIK